MQVRGDIIEVDAQNFYEEDFSCKLKNFASNIKNIKAFNEYFAVLCDFMKKG